MTEKCIWCSKKTPELRKIQISFWGKLEQVKICDSKCEIDIRNFAQYVEDHIKHYIIGLSLSIFFGLAFTFWRLQIDYGALGVLIIFAGCGAVLIKYPFVTPQTIASMGAKKAIFAGRILGFVNIVLGIVGWFVLSNLVA